MDERDEHRARVDEEVAALRRIGVRSHTALWEEESPAITGRNWWASDQTGLPVAGEVDRSSGGPVWDFLKAALVMVVVFTGIGWWAGEPFWLALLPPLVIMVPFGALICYLGRDRVHFPTWPP
jgi:hypothetical protein